MKTAPLTSLEDLADELQRCTDCPLYLHATQAVMGRGTYHAAIVLVGEQPGSQEDLQGRPFVGPSGEVLERALFDSGLHDDEVYITNAVKHFKFQERGRRRLHQKPGRSEVLACREWLVAEVSLVNPQIVVTLGATAGSSLLGPNYRIGVHGSTPMHVEIGAWSGNMLGTIHPAAILRAQSPDARGELQRGFVRDLRLARSLAGLDMHG